MKKNFLFTSESVSEGHPDKVCDRISDMVVDSFLASEPQARVACETLTTTNKVVLAGEVRGPEINKDDLIIIQSELMAALYYHGGSNDEVSDANSNLNKIIYYSDKDGTVETREAKKAAEKIKRAKVVKSKQVYAPLPTSNTDLDSQGKQKTAVTRGVQVPLGPGDFE